MADVTLGCFSTDHGDPTFLVMLHHPVVALFCLCKGATIMPSPIC